MIYLDLFLTFFKIGLFTFGGGYAMIPMINAEVQSHNWMSMDELINFIAVSESTPGPFAVNISTFVGMTQAGILGAACATLGAVLPSFIIILLIAKSYEAFQKNKYVKYGMSGLRPLVVGLIGASAFSIGKQTFFPHGISTELLHLLDWKAILIFMGLFLLNRWKKQHPIKIVLIAALAGILLYGVL